MCLYRRELYLEKLNRMKDTEFVKIITGVRRSGKTYIMKSFSDDLTTQGILPEQIIYMNLEAQDLLLQVQDAEALHDWVSQKIHPTLRTYLFIDEVQEVVGWQRAINSFRVKFNIDIYISGSNASMLSGELATLLSGRYVEMVVYPFSFREYLDVQTEKPEYLDVALAQYITEGGMPGVIFSPQDPEFREMVARSTLDTIVLKDVSQRGGLRNTGALEHVLCYLASEVGNPISIQKLSGVMQDEFRDKTSRQQVARMVDLLADAFVFYEARRYDLRGKEMLRTMAKHYMVDTGLRNHLLGKTSRDNFGHQLENVVYLELLRRGYRVSVGKYDDVEIDFVATKASQTIYIHVTQQLPDQSDRETRNLKYLPDGYQKIVLTANRMDVGQEDGVEIIHVADWLLAAD
jgi:predicted AAA+ superfamily ATPase